MVRRCVRSSDTGNIPTGRQSGAKVSAVKYVELANPVSSLHWSRLTARHAVGGIGRNDGRSECHPIMGWILVESIRLDIIHPARELMSIGYLVYYHHIGRRATG